MPEGNLSWAVPNHVSKYGGAFIGAPQVTKDATAAAPSAGPAFVSKAPPWSPQNPLFWFGAVAAVAVGFMGYSTTVRVGNSSAGVQIGKTS
ncbi:hypothetical protein [Phyllobacterium calauticae]|uniref:hypothetical protein n=1 Tax=Phyllobacterium calauticae TaxID=2817027 RepID=UPI001CBAB79D|nr:hypothetical protein [Phyllobacterium calauticae]MBZ3696035.1 hypothetical protein [Phyllobacterium calauticae]